MKKRNIWIAAAVFSMMITGCGAKAEVEPATFEDTEAVETTVAATEEETTAAETEPKAVIPTKFEVYTDDQPHYLMYGADYEHTYFNTFTSVSRPDLGIASVPFIDAFVNPENGKAEHVVDVVDISDPVIQKTVYDLTTPEWADPNGWGRWIPIAGYSGIICKDFKMTGDTPTQEEVVDLAASYGLISYGDIYVDTLEDGTKLFTSEAIVQFDGDDLDDTSDDIVYRGGVAFRVKDGKAQGAYIAFFTEPHIARHYMRYLIQSIRFAD